jgi:hypothetical protein
VREGASVVGSRGIPKIGVVGVHSRWKGMLELAIDESATSSI